VVSAVQALARPRLELTPEQRTRAEDATAAALRELATELAGDCQTTEIQCCLASDRDLDRKVILDLAGEAMTRDALARDAHRALAIYVVWGPEKHGDPLACFAQSVRFAIDDPAWRRAVLDRLAAKLGKSPADVEKVWAARASERAS
jgi:hypothetical protein